MGAKGARAVLCPSAPPEMDGGVAFGVVAGSVEAPRVSWFERPLPITDDLLALAAPLPPTQVMRFAATSRRCIDRGRKRAFNCRPATTSAISAPTMCCGEAPIVVITPVAPPVKTPSGLKRTEH
jgi:hypothetical protein